MSKNGTTHAASKDVSPRLGTALDSKIAAICAAFAAQIKDLVLRVVVDGLSDLYDGRLTMLPSTVVSVDVIDGPHDGPLTRKADPIAVTPQAASRAGMLTADRKRKYGQPCQWRGCSKNLSPRTRPYCGEHARKAKAKAERAAQA